jgi:hypothetical protein
MTGILDGQITDPEIEGAIDFSRIANATEGQIWAQQTIENKKHNDQLSVH